MQITSNILYSLSSNLFLLQLGTEIRDTMAETVQDDVTNDITDPATKSWFSMQTEVRR